MRFIGNCNDIINWQEIIDSLSTQTPAYVGPRHREDDPIIDIGTIAKQWKDAGYVLLADGGSAGWDMFFPESNFSDEVVKKFSDYVGIHAESARISRIHPGNCAPWHWDANDNEEQYSKMPEMIRFSCNISKPENGHIFIVEDFCLYNQEQGNVWQWPSRKSWHAGSNCGLVPKYLFNIFGTKK